MSLQSFIFYMLNKSYLLFHSFVILILCGCYSFKGISIPPEANTFYVEDFTLRANNAPADINQRFAEALRTKVRNESRLTKAEVDPDIIFEGSVNVYKVEGTAPQEGNTVALNKLTIGVSITYKNVKGESKDDEWTQSFSFFRDFDATIDLNAVEDDFIEEIFEQLTENIFNKAFTNW